MGIPGLLHPAFDEAAFLSPHGLRAVSKRYENNPYTLEGVPGAWIDYEPAESTTSMFGGNSNWRGPVWMPLNYLAIRAFLQFHHVLGDEFTLEYPTGSGEERSFAWIAQNLADRIVSTWLPDADGTNPSMVRRSGSRRTRCGSGPKRVDLTMTSTCAPARSPSPPSKITASPNWSRRSRRCGPRPRQPPMIQ